MYLPRNHFLDLVIRKNKLESDKKIFNYDEIFNYNESFLKYLTSSSESLRKLAKFLISLKNKEIFHKSYNENLNFYIINKMEVSYLISFKRSLYDVFILYKIQENKFHFIDGSHDSTFIIKYFKECPKKD